MRFRTLLQRIPDPEADRDETARTLLPKLSPLRGRSFNQLRKLATDVVKAAFGGGRSCIGWGKREKRPEWWPVDVPWTENFLQKGVNRDHLIDVISSCYMYFGVPLEAPTDVTPPSPRRPASPRQRASL